jgi:hypothetical protein
MQSKQSESEYMHLGVNKYKTSKHMVQNSVPSQSFKK